MPKMKSDPNESKHCPKLPQNVAVAHQLEQPQNIPQCDVEILLFWMDVEDVLDQAFCQMLYNIFVYTKPIDILHCHWSNYVSLCGDRLTAQRSSLFSSHTAIDVMKLLRNQSSTCDLDCSVAGYAQT